MLNFPTSLLRSRLSLLFALTLCALHTTAGVFFREKLDAIDAAVAKAISEKRLPGGVIWLERNGGVYEKAYGQRSVYPTNEPMTVDTIFDAASVTKVIATTSAIMLLIEQGKVKLEDRVAAYIPEFTSHGKDKITIRHLLTHTSGLRPDIESRPPFDGYHIAIERACAEVPHHPPGEVFVYSDINFFVLGDVAQRVTGMGLNEFLQQNVFGPLQMRDTTFLPSPELKPRIAPTERRENSVFRGIVHDPTARCMGGVAGHAGLFTTAADTARFCRMLINEGTLDGVRIFKPETVRLMSSVQSPTNLVERRGLGWDIDSPFSSPRGKLFPVGSYGHTGWTGTSLWIDPFSKTFLIFLSNRNHPDESGSVVALRSQLATLAAESIEGFNFAFVPGALAAAPPKPPTPKIDQRNVLNGIDVLVRDQFAPLKGLKVALITNHTGTDRERNPTIDLLHKAAGVKLVALFSPEHGIRGAMDENIDDSTDAKTGLSVYSLYGKSRFPSLAQLKGVDALVYDIQEIGCRFYTYISTMGNCLQAASSNHVKMIVLDRVNPIRADILEGPILQGEPNFTAFHTIPVRHGMTVGELAKMFAAERNLNADLQVIQCVGWRRTDWLDEIGLPWTNPSPNMRSLTEATLYPGIGLLETALSVGRGTDTPFEVVGAPYINDLLFAKELNALGLPGIRFLPVRFTPKASVHQGKECGGVNLIVTDRNVVRPVTVAMNLAATLERLYPKEFDVQKVQTLLRHPPTIEKLQAAPVNAAQIVESWTPELREFEKRRVKFLLY